MRKTTKVTGTKIAQAAKDLNVTSVTIRRYISEFGIETTTDENGIKVLPESAMDELQEVRRLKEEGMTNPQVLEFLEERRSKGEDKAAAKPEKAKAARRTSKKEKEVAPAQEEEDEESEEAEEEQEEIPQSRQTKKRAVRKVKQQEEDEEQPEAAEEVETESESEGEGEEGSEEGAGEAGDGRLKHNLTCQTCGKSFEHMNPRLRDCLDCYRAKRKERRRGGDRHKNVIQHPLAQQVASKMANQQQQQQQPQAEKPVAQPAPPQRREREIAHLASQNLGVTQPVIGGLKTQVRSYRKAIEETRQITGSLKRRLERPDLPEGDRRWLEQIYAYQLILHQGWRHLSEYRATTNQQKQDD